jgi:hypothetical protein
VRPEGSFAEVGAGSDPGRDITGRAGPPPSAYATNCLEEALSIGGGGHRPPADSSGGVVDEGFPGESPGVDGLYPLG